MNDLKASAPTIVPKLGNSDELPEHFRYKGPGPVPAYWYVDGTKVYRSYEDYCMD